MLEDIHVFLNIKSALNYYAIFLFSLQKMDNSGSLLQMHYVCLQDNELTLLHYIYLKTLKNRNIDDFYCI